MKITTKKCWIIPCEWTMKRMIYLRIAFAAITCIFIVLGFTSKANNHINSRGEPVITDSCRIYRFIHECDTILQCATIAILSDTKISFKLKCYNKLRNMTAEIDGVAVNRFKNFGASETDEDEQGNLYPALEYIYDGKCWFAFRFDTKFIRLIIKEADNDVYNPCCPFGSFETLKRLDNEKCQ